MSSIICPNCKLTTLVPMFYCMRCSQRLLTEMHSNGFQLIFHFEGGVTMTVAVSANEQPQELEGIEIEGPIVRLTLASKVVKEAPSSSLFDVLHKGAELWNLE